jgi:transcriptional regulator with XRE-family HTH domain
VVEQPTLGELLRRARKAAGKEQGDLATAMGVHPKTISRWENDKQLPERQHFPILARELGVPETYFQQLRVREPAADYRPRVALGLPQRIRVFIQEFLLELVNANVPEERVDTIRRILSSDEMYRFYVGGEPKEYSEEETLEGIAAHAEAFRQRLRRQGFKLAK